MQKSANHLRRALGFDMWCEIRHLPLRLSAFSALGLFMVAVPLGCSGCAPIEAQSDKPLPVEAHSGGRPTLEVVATELVCDNPECSKESLSECTSCEYAVRHRMEIASLLEQGKSKEEILDHFAGKYGERILGNPRSFSAAGTPFLVALGGLIPVIYIMRSRHRQAALKAKAQPVPPRKSRETAFGQTDDARLNEALRDFDY
jgi:cytochrome c-type biogenesis protein CcmH/NrfF